MEYILGPKGAAGCPFCEMSAAPPERFRELRVLFANEHAFVVLNRFPFAAGHLMVIPHLHGSDLAALPDATYDELFRLVRATATRLREAVGAQGINVGVNLGEAAGAGIAEHLHVHLVPRWNGDTNFMPVLADVRVIPQHLDDTWLHLSPRFADLPGRRAPSP
jgi:ATP adenylyltransferase